MMSYVASHYFHLVASHYFHLCCLAVLHGLLAHFTLRALIAIFLSVRNKYVRDHKIGIDTCFIVITISI